jgi:hypothetical protein
VSVGTCRSCGAPIIWAMSSMTGKNMPLDAEPTDEGTMLLKDGIVTPEKRATLPFLATNPKRHMAHFAKCPQANEWRRTQR